MTRRRSDCWFKICISDYIPNIVPDRVPVGIGLFSPWNVGALFWFPTGSTGGAPVDVFEVNRPGGNAASLEITKSHFGMFAEVICQFPWQPPNVQRTNPIQPISRLIIARPFDECPRGSVKNGN